MIAYDLQCENGHAFEGWFEDSEAFIAQRERGLIACPICNDTAIAKLPSRFAIKTSAGFKPKPSDAGENDALAQLGGRWLISSRKISTMSVAILPRRP